MKVTEANISIDPAIKEWQAKNRKMGCVAATNWFIKKTKGFKPPFKAKRLTRYTKDGDIYEHVVADNGKIRIDLAPQHDEPNHK